MKNRFTIIVLAAFSLAPVSLTAQAQSARPQSVSRSNARFIRIVSLEVHADQTVTFRYLAPNATKVELSGQFLKKNLPLIKDDKGVWSVVTGKVKPDIYPYNFIVDGKKVRVFKSNGAVVGAKAE